MIDIRTHIFSIIAVFLALGIGAAIGITLAPGTQRRMTTLIAEQNRRIDTVLAEQDHDRVVVKNLEDATGKIYPSLVAGKLSGRRIAVVHLGDFGADESAITDAVTTAGGAVVSTSTLSQHIQKLSPDDVLSIRNELTSDPVTSQPTQDLLYPLVKALTVGTAQDADIDQTLQVLVKRHLLDIDGDYSRPVEMVVIDGGYALGPDDPKAPVIGTEADLANMLKEHNTIVVGCEPENAVSSSIPSFQLANISTVDCIDHAIGKIDLVYALSGEGSDYGWKSTATRLLPASIDNSTSPPPRTVRP